MEYQEAVLGGTFDHLHLGHKDLIDKAFEMSENVTIGLTTEKVYKQKFLSHLIDDFKTRKQELSSYLQEKNYLPRARIIELNDIYGPTLKPDNFQAIFVTDKTYPNAVVINNARIEKKLPQLEIVKVPLRKDENNEVITSERIRLGEIDREGTSYLKIFQNTNLTLPSHLRQELREPIGKAITNISEMKKNLHDRSFIVSIGDIVSKKLRQINIIPEIEIIDFKTRRSIIDKKSQSEYKGRKYTNPPAIIHHEAVDAIKSAIDQIVEKPANHTIVIEGEEDLLTLPAILLAPLNATICYGHFDLKAMILVQVTEEKKKMILDLLRKFE